MTIDQLFYISGGLTLVTAFFCSIRFRNILPKDRPLVYVQWAATANTIVGYFMVRYLRNDYPANNIYQLIDVLCFSTLFYNWGCLYPRKWAIRLLQAAFVLIWILDIRNIKGLSNQNTLFGVVFSFAEALMAIDRINAFIVRDRGNLLRNGRFLCSVSVLIFCSYFVILEVFLWLNPPLSEHFYSTAIGIWETSNILASIIMLLAVFFLPTRERFVLPAGINPGRP